MDLSQAGAAIAAVSAMTYGSHCCFVADAEEITRVVVASYVGDGLAGGDRVMCVLGTRERSWLVNCLTRAGLPVDDRLDDGSLVIVDMGHAPLWQGAFSAVDAADVMFSSIDAALADGYQGLRVWSDMSWGSRHKVAASSLIETERLLQAGMPSRRGMGLCFYDPQELSMDEIGERARNHSTVAGPFRQQAPALQILETSRGIRLIGEADTTTKELLEAALRGATARAAPDADVVVDLSSLAFADTSALQAFYRAAERLGPERRLVVRHPNATLRTVLSLLGTGSAGNVTVEPDPAPGEDA